MVKIHTRLKRKFGLTSSFRHTRFFSGVKKKTGAKTFPTNESAVEYAKKQGITDYDIVPAKRDKRFKIAKK